MQKLIMLLALCLVGCAKKHEQVCSQYPSPYQVVYPDTQVRKSAVALCESGDYVAMPMDHTDQYEATHLTIVLKDANGQPYQTSFRGQ